jgi:regulatory protein
VEDGGTERALALAGRALARRDHSLQAIRTRLDAAGVRSDEAERALEALTRIGLIDDARLAHTLATSLAERGLGDEAILARLEADGIGVEDRRAAVGALDAEERRAVVVARRESGRPRPRLVALLARRGFGEEAVEVAVASLDALPRPEVP